MQPRNLPLLLLLLGFTTCPCRAQSGSGVHSAPGMPLSVGHKVTTPYSPARVIPPTILPRFWTLKDAAARQQAYAPFWLYIKKHTGIPKAARPLTDADTELQAQFIFQLVISPDGSIAPPKLVARHFALEESRYSASVVAALEQEAARMLRTMRFVPTASPDTVAVPISFDLR